MRQVRQTDEDAKGASSVSPQRWHTGSPGTENSAQQASQIGAREICGKGEPHRAQGEGTRAQVSASRGLRSTRTTARQRDKPDGGTAFESEPESLWKTHLTTASAAACALPHAQYTRAGARFPWRRRHPSVEFSVHSQRLQAAQVAHKKTRSLTRETARFPKQDQWVRRHRPDRLPPRAPSPTSIRRQPAPRARGSAPGNARARALCTPPRGA